MAEEKKNINNNMEDKEMSFEERQYQRLIEARNFHYENFNKWSLYFYAIIAALFVGYYEMAKSATSAITVNKIVIVIWGILIIGYICSMCCHLCGRGYYYWENSWISLIHNYEKRILDGTKKNISNRVYSVFADIKGLDYFWRPLYGTNVSSSRLSLFVSFSITCAWGYLISANILDFQRISTPLKILMYIGISCAITYILTLIGAKWINSDLSEFENDGDLKLKQKEEMEKEEKQLKDASSKHGFWIIPVVGGVLLIISIVIIFLIGKAHDKEVMDILIQTILGFLSLIATSLGIYIAYIIQKEISLRNTKNRENDVFQEKIRYYITQIDKLNHTYQSMIGANEVAFKAACANTLSTEAMLVSYALSDIVHDNLYKDYVQRDADAMDACKELFPRLESLSDNSLILSSGDLSIEKNIKELVQEINNNYALIQHSIYYFLHPIGNSSKD